MKKLIRVNIIAVTMCLLFSFMTGCNLFSGGNETGEGFTQSTITLYNEENLMQYIAKYGEKATISIPSKKGYYFEGYFDSREGGTKYIDSEGNSLLNWEKSFPTVLYAHWNDLSTLVQEVTVFDNEPESGGMSGQRSATVRLSSELKSAIKSNFDGKIKIEYSIDIKTGEGWTASPIAMYVKGYESSGAERYEVFKYRPIVGEFTTFSGSVEIAAADFVDGNLYLVIWNTEKQNGSWAYPVYFSRNLTLKISIVTE